MTTNSPNYGPNRNWLDIAKTNEAKAKIRAWFKRECRGENIVRGKSAFDAEMKRSGIPLDEEFIKQIAKRQHFENVDDFYAAIGYGGVMLSKIMQKTKEDYLKLQKPAENPQTGMEIAEAISSRALWWTQRSLATSRAW